MSKKVKTKNGDQSLWFKDIKQIQIQNGRQDTWLAIVDRFIHIDLAQFKLNTLCSVHFIKWTN